MQMWVVSMKLVFKAVRGSVVKRSSKLRAEQWGAPAFRVVKENEDPVRDNMKELPASSGTQGRYSSTNFRGKKHFKEGMVGCAKCCWELKRNAGKQITIERGTDKMCVQGRPQQMQMEPVEKVWDIAPDYTFLSLEQVTISPVGWSIFFFSSSDQLLLVVLHKGESAGHPFPTREPRVWLALISHLLWFNHYNIINSLLEYRILLFLSHVLLLTGVLWIAPQSFCWPEASPEMPWDIMYDSVCWCLWTAGFESWSHHLLVM